VSCAPFTRMERVNGQSDDDLEAELVEEDVASEASCRHAIWIRVAAVAVGFLMGTTVLALALQSGGSRVQADASSILGLQQQDGFPGFPQSSLKTGVSGVVDSASSFSDAAKSEISSLLNKTHAALNLKNLPTAEPYTPPVPSATTDVDLSDKGLQQLAPVENMYDDSPCGADEEFFEGLCYQTCSSLTGSTKPVRCASHICEPLNAHGEHKCSLSQDSIGSILSSPSIVPCHGYDVAGSAEGQKRCPHPAGVCLKDEELYLGTCIKKCSILTNGEFPHRRAFATCCKFTSIIKCLFPGNSHTDQAYGAGGGYGDNDAATPAAAHAPIEDLAER